MGANEKRFGTPEDHVLKQTNFRSMRGGQYKIWEFEEFDTNGQLVARCRHWIESDYYGDQEREGWSKYDPSGNLIASGGDQP